MKKFIMFFLVFIFSISCNLYSQNNSKLILDFTIVDYNYFNFSSKTVSNSSYPNFDVKWYDYIKSFSNPSMQQSISVSTSFYNTLNFTMSKLRFNIFNNQLLNSLLETSVWTGVIVFSTYMPLSDAWLHEEFHRAVLTKNFTNSYNQVNDFPFFRELISVNKVKDEDLIRFKKDNPPDFVRLHSAGIEGEYVMIDNLNARIFFYNQQLPYFAFNITWTLNSVYYVWICHTNEAESITQDVNFQDGTNLEIRDFTGLDFTAWAYDLHRPFEEYDNRGIHQSGVGIDRYIKPSDLTTEELKYLKQQGYLQFLNFLNPMLIGINRIPINIKGEKYFYNIFAHHLLNSFGYEISLNSFFQTHKLNVISGLHIYRNKKLSLPGVNFEIIDYNLKIKNFKLKTSIKSAVWLQPKNLLFTDVKANFGGLISIKTKIGLKKIFPFIEFSYKTKGWVAGEDFQEEHFSIRSGLSWYLF
jgi:hypothetical protein